MNARSTDTSVDTVRRVAEITATLADPFAARNTILAAAGLDNAAWARMESECTQRIHEDTSGALGATYAESFARAKAGTTARAPDPRGHHDPRFLGIRQPWREEAAAVSLDARGEAPRLLSVVENYTRPLTRAATAANDLDATAEIAFGPPRPALPFLQTAPPGRRLHRFDTQTGLPLESPIWIDDPVAANDPTKPA
jgi:hypothetical protein